MYPKVPKFEARGQPAPHDCGATAAFPESFFLSASISVFVCCCCCVHPRAGQRKVVKSNAVAPKRSDLSAGQQFELVDHEIVAVSWCRVGPSGVVADQPEWSPPSTHPGEG